MKSYLCDFYVYCHCHLDGTVFYIGKGCGSRFKNKSISGRSRLWKDYTRDLEFNAVMICDNLTEEESILIEIMAIDFFGRSDLGLGTLINQTGGGRGAYGRVVKDKTRKAIGKSNKGKKRSSDFIKLRSKLSSGLNNPRAKKVKCLTNNKIFNTMQEASLWAVGHKKGNHNISSVCTGKLKTAYGHKWEYVNDM